MTGQPQPGWIGLTRIDGPVGAGIRLGQWADGDGFSVMEHAFVLLGAGLIVEAEPGGARVARLDQYAGRPLAWIPCPPQLQDAVAAQARALVGTPYSFLDYAALATHRLHLPAPGLRPYIADSGHMLCSQLADEAARRAGWHLFADGRWPGYVTPGALRALVPAVEGLPA